MEFLFDRSKKRGWREIHFKGQRSRVRLEKGRLFPFLKSIEREEPVKKGGEKSEANEEDQ